MLNTSASPLQGTAAEGLKNLQGQYHPPISAAFVEVATFTALIEVFHVYSVTVRVNIGTQMTTANPGHAIVYIVCNWHL